MSAMTAGVGWVFAVLGEVEDYFADRSDVVDGDYGQPTPNAEMNLMRSYGVALDAIAELIAADKKVMAKHDADAQLANFARCGCDYCDALRPILNAIEGAA